MSEKEKNYDEFNGFVIHPDHVCRADAPADGFVMDRPAWDHTPDGQAYLSHLFCQGGCYHFEGNTGRSAMVTDRAVKFGDDLTCMSRAEWDTTPQGRRYAALQNPGPDTVVAVEGQPAAILPGDKVRFERLEEPDLFRTSYGETWRVGPNVVENIVNGEVVHSHPRTKWDTYPGGLEYARRKAAQPAEVTRVWERGSEERVESVRPAVEPPDRIAHLEGLLDEVSKERDQFRGERASLRLANRALGDRLEQARAEVRSMDELRAAALRRAADAETERDIRADRIGRLEAELHTTRQERANALAASREMMQEKLRDNVYLSSSLPLVRVAPDAPYTPPELIPWNSWEIRPHRGEVFQPDIARLVGLNAWVWNYPAGRAWAATDEGKTVLAWRAARDHRPPQVQVPEPRKLEVELQSDLAEQLAEEADDDIAPMPPLDPSTAVRVAEARAFVGPPVIVPDGYPTALPLLSAALKPGDPFPTAEEMKRQDVGKVWLSEIAHYEASPELTKKITEALKSKVHEVAPKPGMFREPFEKAMRERYAPEWVKGVSPSPEILATMQKLVEQVEAHEPGPDALPPMRLIAYAAEMLFPSNTQRQGEVFALLANHIHPATPEPPFSAGGPDVPEDIAAERAKLEDDSDALVEEVGQFLVDAIADAKKPRCGKPSGSPGVFCTSPLNHAGVHIHQPGDESGSTWWERSNLDDALARGKTDREGDTARDVEETVLPTPAEHSFGLWDAINAYVSVCGGDTGLDTVGGARMKAVAAVEAQIHKALGGRDGLQARAKIPNIDSLLVLIEDDPDLRGVNRPVLKAVALSCLQAIEDCMEVE
jgi:hypothetical protein